MLESLYHLFQKHALSQRTIKRANRATPETFRWFRVLAVQIGNVNREAMKCAILGVCDLTFSAWLGKTFGGVAGCRKLCVLCQDKYLWFSPTFVGFATRRLSLFFTPIRA
jgi:hypothetical protein